MKLNLALITEILFTFSHALDLSDKCTNNTNAFYWRSSCYVFNPVKLPKESAKNSCNQYGNGHLALITTPSLAVLAGSFIDPLTTEGTAWLAFEQTAPSSNIWEWIDYRTGKRWQLAPKATGVPLWEPIEPNLIATESEGAFSIGQKTIINLKTATTRTSLCQYHDITAPYLEVAKDAKAPADYIMRQMNDTIVESCALKCHQNLPCQSFSHNPATNNCQLNWWAVVDMTTEFDQGYVLYDKE